MSDKKGLSLLEIIISALIMSLLVTGLANLFISGKRLLLHNRAKMTGGELGRHFLDPLQMDVRQDQWGSNCLSGGGCAAASETVDNITYTSGYTVTNGAPIANLNKVKVNITWNEPS